MSGDHKLDEQPTPIGLDPDIFAESARGSLAAHRRNRDEALAMANSGVVSFEQAFTAAEVFARLASSFGDPADRKRLAGMLFKRAELWGIDEASFSYPVAQALAQLDAAADAGDMEAAVYMSLAADNGIPSSLFKLAQQLRQLEATV